MGCLLFVVVKYKKQKKKALQFTIMCLISTIIKKLDLKDTIFLFVIILKWATKLTNSKKKKMILAV